MWTAKKAAEDLLENLDDLLDEKPEGKADAQQMGCVGGMTYGHLSPLIC